MRASHLYTGLFLTPWMVVYALSAFFLNHNAWFAEKLHLATRMVVVREMDFALEDAPSQDPDALAKAILKKLGLEGPYRMMGVPSAGRMILFRPCATGHYRITWQRPQSRLVVERQRPFSFYSLINFLHFQHGYDLPYIAQRTWAVLVDAVTISTVTWVVSGIYLWARRPRKRLLETLSLAAGVLVFAALVILLCR